MLEKNFPLSSKMRISVDHKKLENFSQKHVKFYLKYSSFVFKALKKHSFQKFLHWMLQKEKIEEQTVSAVHVKVLPFRRKNGKSVAGKCNTVRGRIQIYPKTMKFCQTFKQRFGRNTLLVYAGNRARAALIHELLHLKYIADEKTVRALAKDYFCSFTQKQHTQSAHSLFYTMIFDAKIRGKKAPTTSSTNPSARLRLNETCLRASAVFK
jgi:diadenosine tetraphosphate (Ap4A) HIT family hydrolase